MPVFSRSPKSQFPAATFTLKLLLGLRLRCCASAVRALHRANVSHDSPREFLIRTVCYWYSVTDLGGNPRMPSNDVGPFSGLPCHDALFLRVNEIFSRRS